MLKTLYQKFFVVLLALAALTLVACDQQAPNTEPSTGPMPAQDMSFFITSEGPGNGANLGGLAGADAHCQMLASAAGAGGSTWRAYLSTSESGGQAAVNARDRIGSGPWQNANGQVVAQDVGHLHGDTLEQARRGSNLVKSTALNENGDVVNGRGDSPNRHDILTGSQLDGTAFPAGDDHTCGNWTNSGDGSGQVGTEIAETRVEDIRQYAREAAVEADTPASCSIIWASRSRSG